MPKKKELEVGCLVEITGGLMKGRLGEINYIDQHLPIVGVDIDPTGTFVRNVWKVHVEDVRILKTATEHAESKAKLRQEYNTGG